MKNVLFATTALAGLALGGMASAQGISLFGDARLGLGYNINNNGSLDLNEDGETDDDLKAVSRVRFGVNMTGETDSGITFGATIRADNAGNGQGGDFGQRAGNVFVSGSWGTLTFGDTNGADEQWVGDVPGDLSLTGLGDNEETLFISNGGDFGNENGNDFAANPFARPTVRYDFDIAGFGISLSTNRDLNDIGVGAGYAADFGGGSWSVGVGYYDFNEFDIIGTAGTSETTICLEFDIDGNCIDEQVILVPTAPVDAEVPGGHQWSASVMADYEAFSFGLVYTNGTSDTNVEGFDDGKLETLAVGAEFGWDAFTVGAWYQTIMNAEGQITGRDGTDAYGLTAAYDLGGGASINGGVARTFGAEDVFDGDTLISEGFDGSTVADFGIKMSF